MRLAAHKFAIRTKFVGREDVGLRGVTMKAQKVREQDTTELKNQLSAMDEQMFRLRFQMSMGQMEGFEESARHAQGPGADVLTILRERELAAEKK